MDVPVKVEPVTILKKLLSSVFLFIAITSSVFAGEDWQPQPIGPFGTLNNRDSSFAIAADKAQDLLNVDLTPGGKSVRKRKGYASAFALSITSSPVHGVYDFYDANGSEVNLFFNDTSLTSSTNGSSTMVLFSTGPNGATYQCTDSLGSAYCANTSRTTLTKTNGSTYSNITNVSSTGTMVATCVTRLAMAGFSDRPSGIDFSADSDFTTWGTGSLGTSAVQLTVNAPGAKITHITYAFGRLMWFKDTSFGYVLIGNQPLQTDWVIKTVSYDVGTNDNSSVYREGILYFRGKDGHIYAFDGTSYQRISREISQTIALSQTRTINSWTQTSAQDFGASSTTPAMWVDTTSVPGSVFLATTTAISPFIDTVSTDFAAGTLTNVSTITADSVRLAFGSQSIMTSFYPGSDNATCANLCSASYYQSRRINSSSVVSGFLSSVLLRLKKTGSPGQFSVQLMTDAAGFPGTTIESQNVSPSSVATSIGDVVINFSSSTALNSGTTYWIQLVPLSTCDASNKIEWYGTGVTSVPSLKCGNSDGSASYAFELFTTSYQATGNLVSRSFDMGFTTATWLWGNAVVPTSTIPASGNITYEIQTASSATGQYTSLVSVSSGVPVAVSQEFVRYKATFTTVDGSTSPVLNDVSLTSTFRRRPKGTFYSQVNNAPNLTAWDDLNWTVLNGVGTFFIRASSNSFTIGSSTPAWTSIANGAVPSISTGTYFQVRDDLDSTPSYLINPTIFDFTQSWFEGTTVSKSYMTYFNDAILFSIAFGTGASSNNRILKYDLLNQGWLIYDIPVNGFYVKQNNLYFGSSLTGNIYKYGDTDNDNGSAINAYWKSKDFFGGSPFATQELANISVAAKTVANSSMTVTYTTNGSSSTSFTMPLYALNNAFVGKNKNLPAGTIGSTYNLQIGNNAADQPFEVFGIQVGIRPKSWIPTP